MLEKGEVRLVEGLGNMVDEWTSMVQGCGRRAGRMERRRQQNRSLDTSPRPSLAPLRRQRSNLSSKSTQHPFHPPTIYTHTSPLPSHTTHGHPHLSSRSRIARQKGDQDADLSLLSFSSLPFPLPSHHLPSFSPPAAPAADVKAKAAKKAALKGTSSTSHRKVRTSVSFHRPKTLRLPRAPKYPRKSVPHAPRMDEYRTIIHPLATESAMKVRSSVFEGEGRKGREGETRADLFVSSSFVFGFALGVEDRGAQHSRLHRRCPIQQEADQGRRQEDLRGRGRQDQHLDPSASFSLLLPPSSLPAHTSSVLSSLSLSPTDRRRLSSGSPLTTMLWMSPTFVLSPSLSLSLARVSSKR